MYKVILGAKVTNATGDAMYFNVDDDGRLWHVYSTSDVWMSANTLAIRVVARSGKNGLWIHPFKNACCIAHCGFFKKKTLHNLDWDPADH